MVIGTPNEKFIAYKDPKVMELVDYLMVAIITENKRLNPMDNFPIQIYRRYKSDTSFSDKVKSREQDPQKKTEPLKDYLGFKIIPEQEHTIFFADGDAKLQELINQREKHREYIATQYKELAEHPELSFDKYIQFCAKTIVALKEIFPEATARREHYDRLLEQVNNDYANYCDIVEDSNTPLSLEKIGKITNVNIYSLLSELRANYPNAVILYKLKKDLMNVFQNSELLKSYGISVSDNETRTKRKSTSNGYRSEFIGLDLTIRTENGEAICLPIECQVQTAEQYKDGNTGFAAHTKLERKNRELKPTPTTLEIGKKYKDPTATLDYYFEFLSHIKHISPSYAIAKSTGDDFGSERVTITQYDLYEAFRLISKVPKDSPGFAVFSEYFDELYDRREELLPVDNSLLPKYISENDLPNQGKDYNKYNNFFNELRSSLSSTFKKLKTIVNKSSEVKEHVAISDPDQIH